MNEAIVLFILGTVALVLLVAYLYTQTALTTLSIQLSEKMNLERERTKENLEAAWAGKYHVILVNDGSRDLRLSRIYVYVNGSKIPLYDKDMDGALLEAGDFMNVSLLEFGAKSDLDRYGYARLTSNNPSIYFADEYFLSGDTLDFGPNNYSLRRDPGAGDLTAHLGFGSGTNRSLCAWIKMEPNATDDQMLIDADDIKIYYDAHDKTIKASVKGTTLIPTEEIDPGEWNHFCIITEGKNASLYMNGLLDSNGTFGGSLRLDQVALKAPSVRYWIDDLLIAPYSLNGSQVRLVAATGKLPLSNYVLFSFDELVNDISRIDVVSDLGIAHNFTHATISFPTPSISKSCIVTQTSPPVVDCDRVVPTSYIPLQIPGNYSGLYLLRYNRWVRYWNLTGYVTGFRLTYDPSENVTRIDMSDGGGLQLVTTLDLIQDWREVEAMLGERLTIQLIRVDDGSMVEVHVTVDTLSLTDLVWSDNVISGRVIWSDGNTYSPRGDWEYVDVVALETGDEVTVNPSGAFQLNLIMPESEVTLAIFLPEHTLPMFQGYKAPFSDIYVMKKEGG